MSKDEKEKLSEEEQEQPEASQETNDSEAPEEEASEDQQELPPEDGGSAELETLRKKYNDLNERYLRMLAEYDNYRKRSAREKEAVYPTAVAATVEKFLPVLDNFHRALECECSDAEFKKGLEMISSSLAATLEALSVTEFGAVGDPFDAKLHNAVMHIEDENLPKNSIAAVLQSGYRIGDRMIRCAMVTVAN